MKTKMNLIPTKNNEFENILKEIGFDKQEKHSDEEKECVEMLFHLDYFKK